MSGEFSEFLKILTSIKSKTFNSIKNNQIERNGCKIK